ncbi:MAG: peptide ABC transporter substrate-binding protein [Spirochaetaceae bacterium]|jgi:oligopeptide transport system substrate-binding protein|nr:peptide ABC transporter substrate-binding protein [Spirochaetaceae bacterium]
MRKSVLWVGCCFILSAGLVFAGGSSEKRTGTAGGTRSAQKIVFALQNVPDGLDPGITNNSFAAVFLFNLFEGLITYDKDNNIVPALAERWTISGDGTVYTFTLRRGLKWSDGSPLTARDFVYSYFRILDPKLGGQYSVMLTDFIKGAAEYYEGTGSRDQVGIAAPDDNTLILTLKGPTPFFLGILGMWTFSPVQQAVTEKDPERWTLSAATFVSNGPFKVSDIRLGESVTVVKNEHYWNAANVKLEEIVFRYILEPATALTALEAGQIDGLRSPPASEISRLKSSSDAYQSVPSFATTYYLINRNVKPFDDVRVRKALSMAIDREEIISNVLQSSDSPAFGLVSPGYVLNGRDFRENRPAYGLSPNANAAEAKRLLAEAGYPNGQGFPTVQLSYYTDRTVRSIVEVLQQMWKQNLNINAEITNQEWAVYYEGVQSMDYQIGAMGWGGDYLHPMTFLTTMTSNNPTNFTSYNNAEYDTLVSAAQLEVDPAKAVKIMQQAEDLAMDDVAVLPLYHRSNVFMMAPHVKGCYMTPLANLYFRDAYVER